MSTSSQQWHAIAPEGLALAILVVTITLTLPTVAIIALRAYVRTRTHVNSLEDYLMYIGAALNLGHNAAVIYGCYTGIGTRDAKLEGPVMIEGFKMVTIWQLFYVTCSPFIKISICVNLIRISNQRRYIYPLYAVSVLSIAMTIMAFIIVFVRCIPFEASWTGQGKCVDINIIVIPTYIFSAVNILVDWTVSILPAFILWNLQLRRKLKIICFFILAVGVLASIATIIRMPYVPAYTMTVDSLYYLGYVILWTVIELGLGVLAGSLPSLRKLFISLSKDTSSHDPSSLGTDLMTIGRIRNQKLPHGADQYDCELNTIIRAGQSGSSDAIQDKDDDSTRRIIHVTRDISQTI